MTNILKVPYTETLEGFRYYKVESDNLQDAINEIDENWIDCDREEPGDGTGEEYMKEAELLTN